MAGDDGRPVYIMSIQGAGNVIRATRLTLKAQDPAGAFLTFAMDGFEARAVQHELDHLDGLLFIDRVVSRRTDLFNRKCYLSR